ncbi:hypothetical protein CNYM01_09133 [Colletotrichum nymphaeae SA-01]|uniref:Uncharacterized protein n=1 Tax=Colletotrichum nymphaeae SA-01 TaxID=1460502 RepID=A0A135RT34_9PEZI|nr:hypothetical protein CNYM01_09133 [Colletotrichum nymphaeae SA-01]
MEGDGAPAAEASSQLPAKRVKLSSAASDNIKPVFGRLDVALNTDGSGDVTVNVSNTRRLGKPVIDHLSDETFAFHGSRQKVHAMIDRILDYSEKSIITGIVSLQPDTSESAPQSKAPMTTQAVESAAAAATVSENQTHPESYTPTNEGSVKSTATEVEAIAREGPSTPSVTHQSQQTPNVAANPKPVVPQASSLVFTRGHLKTAMKEWMARVQRIKLLTLLYRLPEIDCPNRSVECMILQKLAGTVPHMMVDELVIAVRSWMTSSFERWLQQKHTKIGEDWMHFSILRLLWFYPGKDVDFPWAGMEPNWSAGEPSSAYTAFQEDNCVYDDFIFN